MLLKLLYFKLFGLVLVNYMLLASAIEFPDGNFDDGLNWPPPHIETVENRIPVLYAYGSFYEVGFYTGKVFASMIQEFVKSYYPLNDYNSAYRTIPGKKIYDEALSLTTLVYPQYVRELQGIADGAKVKFPELFLMILDDTMTQNLPKQTNDKGPVGCTSILVNQFRFKSLIHTEDALNVTVNHHYVLAAHIIPAKDERGGLFEAREEIFKALTYAGQLSGYASANTYCDVTYSVNTIFSSLNLVNRIPRIFITRALLSNRGTFEDIVYILECIGGGTADAFNVNLVFLNPRMTGGISVFYHIEVTPNTKEHRSDLKIHKFPPGHNGLHINKLLYAKYPELVNESGVQSSIIKTRRYKQLTDHNPIKNMADAIRVIGDEDASGGVSIWRQTKGDFVYTIMLSIFDYVTETWLIWIKNPQRFDPILQFPLNFTDQISPPLTQICAYPKRPWWPYDFF